jgi:hypothetical protein
VGDSNQDQEDSLSPLTPGRCHGGGATHDCSWIWTHRLLEHGCCCDFHSHSPESLLLVVLSNQSPPSRPLRSTVRNRRAAWVGVLVDADRVPKRATLDDNCGKEFRVMGFPGLSSYRPPYEWLRFFPWAHIPPSRMLHAIPKPTGVNCRSQIKIGLNLECGGCCIGALPHRTSLPSLSGRSWSYSTQGSGAACGSVRGSPSSLV